MRMASMVWYGAAFIHLHSTLARQEGRGRTGREDAMSPVGAVGAGGRSIRRFGKDATLECLDLDMQVVVGLLVTGPSA
jgi:hypothetical protein